MFERECPLVNVATALPGTRSAGVFRIEQEITEETESPCCGTRQTSRQRPTRAVAPAVVASPKSAGDLLPPSLRCSHEAPLFCDDDVADPQQDVRGRRTD